MEKIKKVVLCGLGAVGSIYAEKIQNCFEIDLKILVDEIRLNKYIKNPIIMNGKELSLDYVLPKCTDFKADLVIIATKFDGLDSAIKNISNFVKDDTIILSLLNGVTSEEIIAQTYGRDKIILSYFICPGAVRTGREVIQDGTGKIVFGARNDGDIEKQNILKNFFDNVGIKYEISCDIEYSMWLKYMLNVSTNQPTAILNLTFGEMFDSEEFVEYNSGLMKEVLAVAQAKGIKNTDKMINEAMLLLKTMNADCKTSMLQDVLAKRKTEVELFADTMISFGEKYNIPMPYNKLMKEKINVIQANYQ